MGAVSASALAGQKRAGSAGEQSTRKQARSSSEKPPEPAGKNQVEGSDRSSVVNDDADDMVGRVLVSESSDGEDRVESRVAARPMGTSTAWPARVRITVPELIIRDAWLNWEQDLLWAYRQHLMAQVMTGMRLPRTEVETRALTPEEAERFATWSQYLFQPADFEDARMEAGAFGLGE